MNKPNCCCSWGAALAGNNGEFPEFDCIDCPIHKGGLGPHEDRCKRHRREHANRISAAEALYI